ncbi:MAG TPA: hypothetical protein VMZ28_16995 [Kofleriaceae bacterium]|nr:hypothetical protein [Kofleriaceae bacterium]
MSRRRRGVVLLPFLLPFAACVVDELPDRDQKGVRPGAGEVSDAASPTTPASPGDAAGSPDAGLPGMGMPDAGAWGTGVPDAAGPSTLVATPSAIDFGSREVGTRNFVPATITNTGDAAVRLYIDGTLPDDFGFATATDQPCPFGGDVLPAGDSCVVVVRFFPSEFFIGWDATFSVIATATDVDTDAFIVDLLIPVHGP